MTRARGWVVGGAALGSAVICAALATRGCKNGDGGGDDTGDVVIGAYLAMTGAQADFGINTKRGADLAIDEANKNGGIRGRKIKLVVLDDHGKSDEAGSAVTRLIDVEHARVILGEVASRLSLVGGRICQRR